MARRKRASMREGPLADLFRSTVPPEGDEEEPTQSNPHLSPDEGPPQSEAGCGTVGDEPREQRADTAQAEDQANRGGGLTQLARHVQDVDGH